MRTVTMAVVSGIPGGELAWMMAVPATPPLTGTVTLVACAGMITVAGTLATMESLELRMTVKPPAGAGDPMFRVRVPALGPVMVIPDGLKLAAKTTCTGWVADV